MNELFNTVLNPDKFMPHGHCYYWEPELVFLHVASDSLTGLAYLSIPLVMVYFVRQKKGIPFNWMFFAFAVFIFACGGTHLMEVWNVWHSAYWLAGGIKAVTAVASIATAVALVYVTPRALMMKTPEELESVNNLLKKEINKKNELSEELKNQAAELQTANSELESFSYYISHDLRAPLRAIEGFSKILTDEYSEKLDDEGVRLLNIVRQNTIIMKELIDDLLSFSRMSRSNLSSEVVNSRQLIQDALNFYAEQIREANINVIVEEQHNVIGDYAMLKQVWLNIISNAIKFRRSDVQSEIRISSEKKADNVLFSVADNGIGFDMKYYDQLFQIFQRLHSPEFEGTGVGLALVQKIISRHGGEVWAESKPGEGTVFYFNLKAADNEV